MLRVITFLFCVIYPLETNSARVLGVFPMPSISHQVVFRAFTLEMLKRGHEMVVITPDPAFRNETAPANLTEIDTSESYEAFKRTKATDETKNFMHRGVIMDVMSLARSGSGDVMFQVSTEFLYKPEVQKLIHENQKFDLVIFEALIYVPVILGRIFNAPVIAFSSFHGVPNNFHAMGAVSRHPTLHPHIFRNKFGKNLGLLEKLKQTLIEYAFQRAVFELMDREDRFLKKFLGPDAPSIRELKDDISMLFVNAHPIFDGNRPVPPSVVYLGALHLKPVKKLPKDLQSYLDNSSRGVVYVSLGTNVNPSQMTPDFLEAFLGAFEALPYDILWKFDGDDLKGISKNVRVQKWFPQRDLLGHSNIQVFVTQGGLQSTDEAIDAMVPLVGIPMLADQWYNVNKYVELGIGVEVDSFTMTADDLVKAVVDVIGDRSYKENMKKLKSVILDQPTSPMDRAVWWSEHVIRHGKALHLRNPGANMPINEYLMADVIITILVLVVCSGICAVGFLYLVVRIVLETINKKIKLKIN